MDMYVKMWEFWFEVAVEIQIQMIEDWLDANS